MRYKIFCVIIAIGFSLTVNAQDWQTDIKTSNQKAIELNKAILIVFQGSDWCAPCIKMKKEIWSSEIFQRFAQQS